MIHSVLIFVIAAVIGFAAVFLFRKAQDRAQTASGGWTMTHGFGKPDTALPAIPFVVDAASEPHYVLLNTGPLTGKTAITLTGKVEGAAGMKALTDATAPTDMCLFFQRKGDDWSGLGAMEFYRWWAGLVMMKPIADGEFTLTASLMGEWGSVLGHSSTANAAAFADALNNAVSVGFVLGGGSGLGHGITGTGKITVTSFTLS